MKTLAIASTTLSMACLLAATAGSAATINVPLDQPTIQDAVNASAAGDTIVVAPGVYTEKVTVRKGLDDLVIMGVEQPPDVPFPTIACPGKGDDGVRVKASRVTVSGFQIVGCNNGLRLDYAPGGVGSTLRIDGARTGVNIRNSPGARISGSTITNSTGAPGILAAYAAFLTLDGNVVEGAYREGVRVSNATGATITGNTISGAAGSDGLRLDRVAGGTVSGNVITGSKNDGLRIANSPQVVLTSNRADGNRHFGIRVDKCAPIASVSDVLAAGNTATGNLAGDIRVRK